MIEDEKIEVLIDILYEEKEKEIKETLKELEKPKENNCPVCINGWKGYSGNYDELCNKHYLEIEPTGDKK